MRSQAHFLGPKIGPTLDPNRIFDAEAFRKPLGGLLERSWNPPEPKKSNTETLLPGPRRVPRPISGPKRDGGEIRHIDGRWIQGSLLLFQEGKTRMENPGSFQEKQNQTFPNMAHARLTRPRARWRILVQYGIGQ